MCLPAPVHESTCARKNMRQQHYETLTWRLPAGCRGGRANRYQREEQNWWYPTWGQCMPQRRISCPPSVYGPTHFGYACQVDPYGTLCVPEVQWANAKLPPTLPKSNNFGLVVGVDAIPEQLLPMPRSISPRVFEDKQRASHARQWSVQHFAHLINEDHSWCMLHTFSVALALQIIQMTANIQKP